jgi:hypothetical protein
VLSLSFLFFLVEESINKESGNWNSFHRKEIGVRAKFFSANRFGKIEPKKYDWSVASRCAEI